MFPKLSSSALFRYIYAAAFLDGVFSYQYHSLESLKRTNLEICIVVTFRHATHGSRAPFRVTTPSVPFVGVD